MPNLPQQNSLYNMRKIYLSTILFLSICFSAFAQNSLKSPADFLGYELGEHFTYHHKVVSYFEHAAAAMPNNVKTIQYGQTYERRPLMLVMLSSAKNIQNLETIRTDNLKRAGLMEGSPSGEKIPLIWFSYNVHGNESVSMEAVMMTFHEMATDPAKKEWLDKAVIIFDPSVNPDGRDRYANWYNQKANKILQPDINSTEHREPWPGGRANHYLFDLNRDWAWQTQIESKSRMEVYNQWMPQIHVDFHEQGINNPYYFAPAAEPLHEIITDWQREFQVTIGKNNAKYFDQNSWVYFTKESFDLLYPSYGDTYPMYNGAIGMTYEKGGSGAAGLGVLTNEGDTLTLLDRITHHHTTGISTIEVTVQNAEKVVDEFQKFFTRSKNEPWGKYKTYIIPGDQDADRLIAFTKLLDQLGIEYGSPASSRNFSGYAYLSTKIDNFTVSEKDIIISSYQPRSVMANVLFDPNVKLSDSLTYDITAWAMPYVYGLRARATESRIDVAKAWEKPTVANNDLSGKPYAYLLPWTSIEDLKFLASLHKDKITVRQSTEPFSMDGKEFDRGTLIITRRNNEHMGDKFDEKVKAHAQRLGRGLVAARTGFVSKGKDFGSSSVRLLKAPKVALVSGNGTSSLSFGENWYYFEQIIDYPLTVLESETVARVDLSEYDVLIMPSGGYGGVVNDSFLSSVRSWVQAGGRLILIDGALSNFADKDGFALKRYADDSEKKAADDSSKADSKDSRLAPYADRQRNSAQYNNPGSIWLTRMDVTHPLAFGYKDRYYSLKTSSQRYAWLENGWNVGVIKTPENLVSGFVGNKAKGRFKEALNYGVQNLGRGQVIYMADNPLFRAFWYDGHLLYGNAVFLVGN